MTGEGKGWHRESARHALAAKGIKSGRKVTVRGVTYREDSGVMMAPLLKAALQDWKHKDASKYVNTLMKQFGPPKYVTGEAAVWHNIAGFSRVEVRDESIPHNFPTPHRDWLYATKKLKVPPKLMDDLGTVTGSIIIDGLKGEVTTRCQMLVKDAVTMGFVEDVVAGKTRATKAEYAKRIRGNVVPRWYKDKLGEK